MDLEPECRDVVRIWKNGIQDENYEEHCNQNVIPQSSTTGNRLM